MSLDLSSLPDRQRSWNTALAVCPGDLDLTVSADDIRGAIPEALRQGRFLSNGPGWNRYGDRLAHPFDGHGYVRRFSFGDDGSVSLKARFVRTSVYKDEAAAGGMVHRGFATNAHDAFWRNLKFGTPRNVANTTVLRWQDQLLCGWEAGSPWAVDPETLETIGEHTFDGLVEGQSTLAHMYVDGDRLILCNIKQGRETSVTYRELGPQGLIQERTGTLPGMAFAHDFAFTKRWYVLGGNPLSLKPWELAKALLGGSTLLQSVKTNLSVPGTLVLVPRDQQGPTRVITLPEPAFVVHFANAFEEDGVLVADVCIFHSFDFGEEFGYAGPNAPFDPRLPERRGKQTLYRVRVPDDGAEATWESLSDHGIDFPRIRPGADGTDVDAIFGATRQDTRYSDPFDSLIRVDTRAQSDQLWTAEGDVFIGEPVVTPSGHVVALQSDGLAERTTLLVFEGDQLDLGPVAQVPLPLLPVAFHGDWDGA